MSEEEIRPHKHADEIVRAPIDGMRIKVRHVVDPVFALQLLGKSVALVPSSSTLVSPIAGTVTLLPDTLHAYGITSEGGAEVLVHAGIDTIMLHGAPFTPHVKVGDHVEAGDVLADIDFDAIHAGGYPDTVIMIVTNTDEYEFIEKLGWGLVAAGDEMMRLTA